MTGPPQPTPPQGMRAAFLRPTTVRAWSHDQLAAWIDRIAASPVDTVVLKAHNITTEVVDVCRRAKVAVTSSVACFSDHAANQRVASRLRPIDEHGRVFDKMAWYEGVVPTDQTHNAALRDRVAAASAIDGVSGVVLDFLRWPLHWTVELRTDTPAPRRGSFDPASLARFRDWMTAHDLDPTAIDAARAQESARVIHQDLQPEWRRFRCDVINELARELVDTIHAAGRWAGIFVVPVPDRARRDHVGQDTATLGDVADVLLAMSYHGIMHQPPTWPVEIARDVAATTDARQVPAVQATSDQSHSGDNDWGPPIDADEFATVAAELDRTFGGFFIFPGDALDDQRSRLLGNALDIGPQRTGPHQ